MPHHDASESENSTPTGTLTCEVRVLSVTEEAE